MKIYYKIDGQALRTPCPHGKKTYCSGLVVNTGSLFCKGCEHFISHNKDNLIVECGYVNGVDK